MKLYQICDSVTKYCCSFSVAKKKLMTTYQLVLDLTHDFLGRGHKFYIDQYYTLIPLFHKLFVKQIVAVGTCMANRRGLPKNLVKQRLPRGGVVAFRYGALLALKLCVKHNVLVLSTKHTPAMQDVSVKVPAGCVFQRKPILIKAYNSYIELCWQRTK